VLSDQAGALGRVADLRIDAVRSHRDPRGVLHVLEFAGIIPFIPVRLFWTQGVPAGTIRGEHGHKRCSQYLICCAGEIDVATYDGAAEAEFKLATGDGFLIRPGIYSSLRFQTPASVLLALCDRPYEAADYLHSRDELKTYRQQVAL
jgi:WxcM-like, C-terminal